MKYRKTAIYVEDCPLYKEEVVALKDCETCPHCGGYQNKNEVVSTDAELIVIVRCLYKNEDN